MSQAGVVYISNPIEQIRQSHVLSKTHQIMAQGQVCCAPSQHNQLSGPTFLLNPSTLLLTADMEFNLTIPELDLEICLEVWVHITHTSKGQQSIGSNALGAKHFKHFSSLNSLLRTVACLSHIIFSFAHSTEETSFNGWHICDKQSTAEQLKKRRFVIWTVHCEIFSWGN